MNYKPPDPYGVTKMMSQKENLKLLLAYLLDIPSDRTRQRHLLEDLAVTDQDEIESLLQRLEGVINGQDDPEWLEEVAAAKEGLILPEVAQFLAEREALLTVAPNVVMQFDMLLEDSAADEEEFLADFPTFAEQFGGR